MSYLFGECKFLYSSKLLRFKIKSINPILKFPHIFESYASILKILVMINVSPVNFLVSFELCSTPKLSKYAALLNVFPLSPFTYKTLQCIPIMPTQRDFLHIPNHTLF